MDTRITGLKLRTALSCVVDLVLPRVCLICGRMLMASERYACMCCLADMPKTYYSRLEHNPMADRLNERISSDKYEPYARATALFRYDADSAYRFIPQALKYGRNFASGRFFTSILASELAGSELFADVDVVLPVPLHWTRRLKRGYNQAEIIAREIVRVLNEHRKNACDREGIDAKGEDRLFKVRCDARLLARKRKTVTQTLLAGEAKSDNVRGAFRLRENYARRHYRFCADKKILQRSEPILAHHILIVDDVYTSGATTAACYAPLREYFGTKVRISVATLAFVDGG